MLIHNQRLNFNSSLHLLIFILIFAHILIAFSVPPAWAQDDSARILKIANDKYELGYFNQTIALLDSCLSSNVFQDEVKRVQAYALLARAYIGEDYPDKAEDTVKKLLDLRPYYDPTTLKDPKFLDIVEKIKEQREQQRKVKSKRKWFLIAGGTSAIVAGVAAVLISGGGEKADRKQPLPLPPPLP